MIHDFPLTSTVRSQHIQLRQEALVVQQYLENALGKVTPWKTKARINLEVPLSCRWVLQTVAPCYSAVVE
jgi:hypothetical protein